MNEIIITLIIALLIAGAFFAIGYLLTKYKNSSTANKIDTVDQILELVYSTLDNIFPSKEIIDDVYDVLDKALSFAQEMVKTDTLDKKLLLEYVYSELAILYDEPNETEKSVIKNCIDLIYMFVRK